MSPHRERAGRSSLAKGESDQAKRALEKAWKERDSEPFVLRLYVAGITPRSSEAVANVSAVCEEHLAGRYELEIVDIYQRQALAEGEQIIAAPTLIRKLPLPLRRLVGDLSTKERILVGLDLRPKT